MKCQIQIVTTPTADTPGTAAVLAFDDRRYVIGNVSEGTQRALGQFGLRLMKTGEVFLTGVGRWHTWGGLVGLILTMADAVSGAIKMAKEAARKKREKRGGEGEDDEDSNAWRVSLFGPPNLTHTLATMRRFVFRKQLPLYPVEVRDCPLRTTEDGRIIPTWTDHNIKVWAIPVVPTPTPVEQEQEKDTAANLLTRSQRFDEFMRLDLDSTSPSLAQKRDVAYDTLRKSVVADMFNSSWRLDALEEMALEDVQLPATIYIRDPATKQTSRYIGPIPGNDEGIPLPDPQMRVLVRRPWPAALVPELPPTMPQPESLSYVLQTWPQRGRFLPQEARRLGVKPGPEFRKLTDGNPIVTAEGVTITPEMVMEKQREGKGVAVIEIPTKAYVEGLVNRPEWSDEGVSKTLIAVVWILGEGVLADERLRAFMHRFGSVVRHVVSAPEICGNRLAMDSVAAMTVRLNQVDPQRYTPPVYEVQRRSTEEIMKLLPANTVPADRGLTIAIEPTVSLTNIPSLTEGSFNIEEVRQATQPEVIQLGDKARLEVDKASDETAAWRAQIPNPEAEVIALGTGSAMPSKYRNVSATLVRVPGYGSYLLDCGENTLGQINRVFGVEGAREVMRDLRMIWISHMHADHHLGTVSIIRAWYEATQKAPQRQAPLAVISDEAMIAWLAEYSQAEDYGYRAINPISITSAEPSKNNPSILTLVKTSPTELPSREVIDPAALPSLIGLSSVQAATVSHCLGAKAVSLTFPDGFKVSYSGDCRPSKSFARIGKDTTLLIHEATFDDELQGDAVAKKHSTTSEALEVGQEMGARAVLLTHFSQRYQKIPVMEFADDATAGAENGKKVVLEDDEDLDDRTQEADAEAGAEADAETEDVGSAAVVDSSTSSASLSALPLDNTKWPASPAAAAKPDQLAEREAKVRVRTKDMKVAVAFDYMRIRVGDFWQMAHFTEALVTLLATQEEGEAKDKGGANGNAENGNKKNKRKRNN